MIDLINVLYRENPERSILIKADRRPDPKPGCGRSIARGWRSQPCGYRAHPWAQ
jgi:hypothetical protein